MHCKFCGFANGEDDHRCLRCGRRTSGVAIAAPASYSGANALAVAPAHEAPHRHVPAPLPAAPSPPQPTLFPPMGQKVIPFDPLRAGKLSPAMQAPAVAAPTPVRTVTRKTPAYSAEQTTLDFVPASSSAPRTLKTAVPAQIYCDHQVATPIHRFVAGAMDAAMILLAFGLFIVMTEFAGGSFGEGKIFWGLMLGAFVLIASFYGLIWALAGRETVGMDWTELRLVTFDGFAVEPRARAVRTAATWLSFCAGGIGVLWAAADEEKLAWHDHISKTFPTLREAPGSFNRERHH